MSVCRLRINMYIHVHALSHDGMRKQTSGKRGGGGAGGDLHSADFYQKNKKKKRHGGKRQVTAFSFKLVCE